MSVAEVSQVVKPLVTVEHGRQSSSVLRKVYGEALCLQTARHDGVSLLNGYAWAELNILEVAQWTDDIGVSVHILFTFSFFFFLFLSFLLIPKEDLACPGA